MAYIRYDPNKPGDRERAYGQFFIGFILLFGTVGSAFYFLCTVIPFVKGILSKDILYSLGFSAFMGILDFFILALGNKQRKTFAGKFFTIYFGGMLEVAAISALIVSISSLYREGTGLSILILSIFSILIVTVSIWILYQKFDGKKLFTASNHEDWVPKHVTLERAQYSGTQTDLKNEPSVIFCHKCGKQLPDDSAFCSSCGAKLK